MTKSILPLFFIFVLKNVFAQQVIIHPNWNIGEEKKLRITTITPRELDDNEIDSDDSENAIIEEDLSFKEKLTWDTMHFSANWKVISKTDSFYEMEWRYTGFEMNKENLDEYTLTTCKIYDSLSKCPPVRYKMGLNGSFINYSTENSLEQAIKSMSQILNVNYEAPFTEEELDKIRIDDNEEAQVVMYEHEENTIDNEGNLIEGENIDLSTDTEDFNFDILEFSLRSTMESLFTERLEKIHSFFGDTCQVGVKKDVSQLDLKELEELGKMRDMLDLKGNILLTELTNNYNYYFEVKLEMGDFFKKMMEGFQEAFEEEDKGKKKKKKNQNEDDKMETQFLETFQMNMAINGAMNMAKNSFWPKDLFYTIMVKGNVEEKSENKNFDASASEGIIFE